MSSASALSMLPERRRDAVAAAPFFPLRAELVRTREAFDALASQWAALETEARGALLFQSSAWARAVFDFEARRGNAAFDPVIVALHDGRRLVGVLPLERIRTRSRTVLSTLGQAFAQYSDVLIAPGTDPRDAVARMLRAAITAAPCDGVSFLKVRDNSALAQGMPANRIVTGEPQGAPYVALDGFPDYAAYFATIKSKTRKNLRNARNRLEREGEVSHAVAATPEQTRAVIDRTLSGRAQRLRDQGLNSRAFRDGAFADFCLGLPDRNDMRLMAMSLLHNGTPIAEQWGFVHANRYYAFVATRDFDNSDESPGKLHLGEVTHACADAGLDGADLMVPVMPYKLTWATETVTVTDYALPVTPRGLLVLNLWDRNLRPRLKSALLKMPAGLRSLLMRSTGRGV
jgi:CelD/BcsL family acetyltransferase involved in cellulose biosynthesis